jgi:AcrR family transcriptional regulator
VAKVKGSAPGSRPPGRPRKEIDPAEVAEAAGRLFASGGYDAVSIEAVSQELAVSRATLYRTVSTKEHLLAILFERSTQNLDSEARELLDRGLEPAEELATLVELHIKAAIETRRYMAVFFGGAGLPTDVYRRWQSFSREYETLWTGVVSRAMEAGVLAPGDAVLTTRVLLGMVIWVSRWYRPSEPYSGEQIAQTALSLISAAPAR